MRNFTRALFEAIDIRPRRSPFYSFALLGAGLAVGAIGAALMTPRTGAEMREELGGRARRLVSAGKDRWNTVRDSARQLAHQAEDAVHSVAGQMGRASAPAGNHRRGPGNGTALS